MSRQKWPGKLTETQIKKLKPKSRPYKVSDGGGLYLLIHPNGSCYWRVKYRIDNKEKILSLGVYTGTKLEDARKQAVEAKKLLDAGTDPAVQKRRNKMRQAENCFKGVALEWWGKEQDLWTADHAARVKQTLEREAFPVIGDMPIDKVTAQDCLQVVRNIEARDALDVASRVKQRMAAVFRYAIYTGYVDSNPVDALRDVIKSRKVIHQKALDLHLLPQFLNDVDECNRLTEVTRLGLKLLVHCFVRPGELKAARWSEIDWNKLEWRIPAERMKMRETHIVPLAPQTITILTDLQAISGKFEYIFPGYHNPRTHMSENALTYAIRKRLNFDATSHGFRTVASTVLNENGFRPDIIERQLAHSERNKVRAAYNRALYLSERREMMEWWANHLTDLLLKFRNSKR